MDFSDALRAVKDGKRARRAVWAEVPRYGGWLELVELTASDGRESMPQLLIGYPSGVLRPFAGANWDLLAEDWEIVP